MVAGKTHQGKTIKKLWLIILLFIVVAAITCAIFLWTASTPETEAPTETPAAEAEPEPEPEIVKIDLQPVVETWAASTSGNRSVLIYDLDREEVVASYNTKEDYNTASLYKLFVVYEGYRRLETGEWSADTAAGYTGKTIAKCLDLAIRESNSPCAETLWAMIGHSELDEIVENDFGITNSSISNLVSNVEDITEMMKIFYKHADITNETLLATIKDSFLNQPVTTYDWRRGLPSGFSDTVKVYNKVGWDRNAS